MVASHVTEPGSLLTEPGAVISAVTPEHVCYKYILKCVQRLAQLKGLQCAADHKLKYLSY